MYNICQVARKKRKKCCFLTLSLFTSVLDDMCTISNLFYRYFRVMQHNDHKHVLRKRCSIFYNDALSIVEASYLCIEPKLPRTEKHRSMYRMSIASSRMSQEYPVIQCWENAFAQHCISSVSACLTHLMVQIIQKPFSLGKRQCE